MVQHHQSRLLWRQEGASARIFFCQTRRSVLTPSFVAVQTLVLLHVLIPPLSSLPHKNFIVENPAQALAMFEMREVTVRRFLAGRMRD